MMNHARASSVLVLLTCCHLALGGIPRAHGAPTTPEGIRSEVEGVLVHRHLTTTPDWWLSLGSAAPDLLIEMYGETRQKIRRLRLLEGIAVFSNHGRAVEFLKTEARATKENSVRQVILESLGRSQPETTVEFQEEFLAHPDPQTRLAAAQALQSAAASGSADANAVLSHYQSEEKTPWILDRLKLASAKPTRAPLIAAPPPGMPVAPQSLPGAAATTPGKAENASRAGGDNFAIEQFAGRWIGQLLSPAGPLVSAVPSPAPQSISAQPVEITLRYDSKRNLLSGEFKTTAPTPTPPLLVLKAAPDLEQIEVRMTEIKTAGAAIAFSFTEKNRKRSTSVRTEWTGEARQIGPAPGVWVLEGGSPAAGTLLYLARN